MSVNYHAYQNIRVPFADCEALSEQWWGHFTGYNPERIARILHLQTDDDYLYLTYYGIPYRLVLATGRLEKEQDGGWTGKLYVNETMAVYHLLDYTVDQPVVTGVWVPGHTLDGVVSRRRMADPLLDPFARAYSGRTVELRAACEALRGKKLGKGDLAYQFEAFPRVELQLVFWDADEDFPAQVQIFVDQRITDFMHFETVGCLTSDLFEKICAWNEENPA